ncbi:uncharacterized protein FIBRA_01701 [Fibroporia radiculosa]|uniref:Chromo domain-containing protein n=1 Tax=Fibroporia radiculosa TaxID=599839 RepID=J4GL27_9APHY|nr:uncharacterized protein FIBRA_01701 [Fibroporia radiculosa]CCL99680.1 predicted protein [Fibroporia radiculosa]
MVRIHVTPLASPSSSKYRKETFVIEIPVRKKIRAHTKVLAQHKSVVIDGQKFTASPILDVLFEFMAERHRIFKRRLAHEDAPWTDDRILAVYPFTNVYRIYDRVTQYVLRHVIREGEQDLHEACFRVMLFRSFNKVETWNLLRTHFGKLTWREFDVGAYEKVLCSAEQAIYGHAYIIPAPKLGVTSNAGNHLRLIQLMMEQNVPGQLRRFRHLKDAHGWLSIFPSMGDFTSLQYVSLQQCICIVITSTDPSNPSRRLLLDLNMLPFFNFSENEWIALGPGSLECIRKIFGPSIRGREYSAFRYIHSIQHEQFARLGILANLVPRLCKNSQSGVTMVDLEHSLCECEKYSRARFPEITGRRKNVAKCIWRPSKKGVTADLPEHWAQSRIANASVHLTKPPPVNDAAEYEVSHIVAEKSGHQGRPQYLVRWVGYSPEDDTWQREADLVDGAACVLKTWKDMKDRIWSAVSEYQKMGSKTRRNGAILGVEEKKFPW